MTKTKKKKKPLLNLTQQNELAKELADYAKKENLLGKAVSDYVGSNKRFLITREDIEGILWEAIHYVVDRATRDKEFDREKAPFAVYSKFHNRIRNFIRGEQTRKRGGTGYGCSQSSAPVKINLDKIRYESKMKENAGFAQEVYEIEHEIQESHEDKLVGREHLARTVAEFIKSYENRQNSRFGENVGTPHECVVSRIFELVQDGVKKEDIQKILKLSTWRMRLAWKELEEVGQSFHQIQMREVA